MELQDRYDELEKIIMTLDSLIDDVTDSDYKEDLKDIKYKAQDELDELEPKLHEEYDKECRARVIDYMNDVL